MVIRNLHLSDFLKLGRLHEANVGLDVLGSLVVPHSLRNAAISQHLPAAVNNFNSSVYIYEEPEGKPYAYVQARARQRRDEWDILALGTVAKYFPASPPTEDLKNEEKSKVELSVSLASDASIGVSQAAQKLAATDELIDDLELIEEYEEEETVDEVDNSEHLIEEDDEIWPGQI